jgi:hypothetical protein
MNAPESEWLKRVEAARADRGPAPDMDGLLRAVRAAANEPRGGWTAEIAVVFARGRLGRVCLLGAAASAIVASWQVWMIDQALPWAQLLVDSTGGTP